MSRKYCTGSGIVIYLDNRDKYFSDLQEDILYLFLECNGEINPRYQDKLDFPKGTIDKGEYSLDCAIRETEEEINIFKDHYNIVGNLPKFFTGTGFVVTPFLGIIKSNSNWRKFLKPNLSEVEQIFFPPTECLLSPEYHLRQKPPTNSSMLMTWAINYNNKNIWGLTARV